DRYDRVDPDCGTPRRSLCSSAARRRRADAEAGRRDHLHRIGGDSRAFDRQTGTQRSRTERHQAGQARVEEIRVMRWTFALVMAATLMMPSFGRAEEAADYDPWQKMNRGIFWFNDRADHYVLEPVAKGWDIVMPEPAETG